MRIILVAAVVVLFLILGIPLYLLLLLYGKFDRYKSDLYALRIVQGVFKFILWISGVKLTVIGEERVPKDVPVLYVANHNSMYDVLLTYSRCPRLTGYVAKKEILKVPLLRDWMKKLYCLFLDRENPREGLKTILAGIDQVKRGISVCIFPEGTRSKDGEMIPFKEGSLKIAEKSGCPIVPMALTNTGEIFENHFPWVRSCRVILEYGDPIDPKQLPKEERKFLGAYTQGKIQEMLDKNKVFLAEQA